MAAGRAAGVAAEVSPAMDRGDPASAALPARAVPAGLAPPAAPAGVAGLAGLAGLATRAGTDIPRLLS